MHGEHSIVFGKTGPFWAFFSRKWDHTLRVFLWKSGPLEQYSPCIPYYYALRIFHVYKCTVNENTNKSAYWYTSHKFIPGFGKPGIVAEICPSGFVHASYLPSDWLTLVWTHPLSQIGNNTFFPNHDNWVVPFTCCDSQCCLAPKCFLLKIKHFGWFP